MDDKSQGEARLLERSKQDFDAAVAATDGAVVANLRAARARAVAQRERRSWGVPPRFWVPAIAVAGLAAIVLVPRIESTGGDRARDFETVAAAADLELLLGEEELEMFAELEFYEWLEAQEGLATDGEAQDGVG